MILPLRAVLFQLFFLWVAIAIESFTLHKQLGLSKRISLEYAAILNLSTAVVGWLIFFYVESVLPAQSQEVLINFILFNRLSNATYFWLTLIVFILFFLNWVIKTSGFDLLFSIAKVRDQPLESNLRRDSFAKPVKQHFVSSNTASVLLRAQIISHCVMLAIIVAQIFLR